MLSNFFTDHTQHAVLEFIFMYLAIFLGIILIILGIALIRKIKKNNKILNDKISKDKQNNEKRMLDLLKNKINKTY